MLTADDIDRLDRLTTIVERTRLTLGRQSAQVLWHMLGLPLLRTSRMKDAEQDAPDLFAQTLAKPMPSYQAQTVRAWVEQFVAERCVADPRAEMRVAVFREAYGTWAKSVGAPIPPMTSLGRYVVNIGIRRRKSGVGIYVGLRLRDGSE